MSVYYKFNSELNYSYVDFDGLHISVSDLKKAILHQKRLGKSADFDLLISNAQTKEEYKDEHGLIPKNTSLIVARIPISNQNKKSWELAQNTAERAPQNPIPENINHDITRMNGSEEDKIQAMMMQSAGDYDPTNYQRVRGSTQTGDVPPNYRCHKCNKPGHWIKNCPLNVPGKEHHHFKTRPESKKMTGIPRSLRDNIGENQETTQNQFVEEKREIPEDLICTICKGIFKDAVMIPCCGSSFCDECVRTALLESEDNECPDCKEKGTSPGSLIPNRFLRNAVVAFYAESSNVMVRDNPKKEVEAPIVQENFEEVTEEATVEPELLTEPEVTDDYINTEEDDKDDQNVVQLNLSAEKESESEDDDDNITVTVPPAHQQSRGNAFRDTRLRRVPSHGMGDYHSSRNHPDDDEHYEEESSDSYVHRQNSSGSKHHNYDHSSSSQPQGISTLVGDDNGGNTHQFRSSSSSSVSNQNMPHSDSQNAYQQHQQQPPPIFNQNQHQNHSGMMPHMHSHSMYPQGHYHQPSGPYYPPNQIRPMRFEHQGNYQVPMRHQHPSQMMRPSMHDNFNMRHQRPPINHLANAVTHNIQQRYGTGIIDDPLEAFNRIMREKEMRKERYRRSPVHNNERRSRSFERKRSPVHAYSPENRRQKNYIKVRKRSRSFKSNSSKSYSRSRSRSRNRSTRGRSKSRSYSPRYRRKENIQSKDRRDERQRSPPRRGGNQHNNSRGSRSTYKNEPSFKQGLRDPQENHQYHDNIGNQYDKIDQNFDYQKDSNVFEAPHSLDEQPPPPGDDAELMNLIHVMPTTIENEVQEKNNSLKSDDGPKDSIETNGSHRSDVDTKETDHELKKSDHHHHHHKKSSRSKNYETSSDDKKVRDKKKQKKSREHEKKKNKKDRKDRSEKEKTKKPSSKAGSKEKTPEPALMVQAEHVEADSTEDKLQAQESFNEDMIEDDQAPVSMEAEAPVVLAKSTSGSKFKRSDSFLDINPNVDLDLDEWIAPEVSKWEREENKSLDNSEADVSSVELKKNSEEKVTTEILKRAENAIFARAISAIRPVENKKLKVDLDYSLEASRKEDASPITSVVKKIDGGRDSKVYSYQVTVPTNETGTRSIELKSSEGSRKKSPMKSSIKNRLGIKIIEKKSKSRTPSRSPKRRVQSDIKKVVRSSRDRGSRPQTERERPTRERYPSSENRRSKQLSSFVKSSHETKSVSHNSRSRHNDKRRSPTPDDRKPVKRYRTSKSRSRSRHNARRHDQRSNTEKSSGRSRELPTRSDDKSSKVVDQPSSDVEKAKAKSSREAEPLVKKRSRDSSSSSTSSSASSNDSQKPSKKHNKHKVKKKSRSLSVESNGNSKRKKSKKEKKAKKKKKSRK